MLKIDATLERLAKICLALPGTKMTITWGEPHFRVGDKIFSGYGKEDGRMVIGFKLALDHALGITADPRFRPAKYGGPHGWVSMDISGRKDWKLIAALVDESYRLIAPKRLVAQLESPQAPPPPRRPRKPSPA